MWLLAEKEKKKKEHNLKEHTFIALHSLIIAVNTLSKLSVKLIHSIACELPIRPFDIL